MEEIWKDIIGYEGYYQVSSIGRVKSMARERIYKNGYRPLQEKILNPSYNSRRYYTVVLQKNGVKSTKTVHRLVADVFIPNHLNKKTVNHIDGNKSNNNISNLEWSTYSENNQHAIDTGLRKSYWTGKKKDNSYHNKKVIQYDENMIKLHEYKSITEAKMVTGANNISICCIGIQKTSGGFIWKYA